MDGGLPKYKHDNLFKTHVLVRYNDINEFIHSWINENTIYHFTHFIPQTYFLCDKKGEAVVDYIAKFETMESDFNRICDILGQDTHLPHVNKTTLSRQTTLSDASKLKLKKLYSQDFNLLGYDP